MFFKNTDYRASIQIDDLHNFKYNNGSAGSAGPKPYRPIYFAIKVYLEIQQSPQRNEKDRIYLFPTYKTLIPQQDIYLYLVVCLIMSQK